MKIIRSIAFYTALFFLASCIDQNSLRVDYRNFDQVIEQQQNLTFSFNRELAPDSLIDSWDTLSYLSIAPSVEGRYKWNNSKELVFSPTTGFRPATEYTITLTGKLLRYNKEVHSLPSEKTFLVHTPDLKLAEGNAYWAVSEKFNGMAALFITLTFNYNVDPATVAHLLSIKADGKTAAFELRSESVGKEITLIIDNIPVDEVHVVPVSVEIEKGLKCVDSQFQTPEKMQLALSVPSPDELQISQALSEYEGSEAMIHVYTNQAVDAAGLQDLIGLDPKLPFTIRQTFNGFFIDANFSAGTTYQLSIDPKVKGLLGGKMSGGFTASVAFGEMEPALSFVNQDAIYLSSKSAKNVAVRITSIPKVQVTVWKIYENNILQFLRNSRYTDYWYDEEGGEGSEVNGGYAYNTYDIDYYGNKILDRTYETRNLPLQGGVRLLNLNMDETGTFRGTYLVQVSSTEEQWIRTVKLISISDLGLIVKNSDDQVTVFLNSIMNASPVSGVDVSLISTNNQKLMTVRSNHDGVAVFKGWKEKTPGFTVKMVTAQSGEDFNFLSYSDSRVNTSRYEVGGRRSGSTGLMAFMYGDRNIYRPGETIHMNTIVRDESWNTQAGMPVKFRLLMPNGREFKSLRATLDRQGSSETSIDLPASAMTGNYSAEVLSANDVLIGSKSISVEEFLPDRIDVKLNGDKEELHTGDSIRLSLLATNYFGPPASDKKYEMEFTVTRKPFFAKAFPGYSFDIRTSNNMRFTSNDRREGKTDERGSATEVFNTLPEWKDEGLLSGRVFATVFDETGRPVNRSREFRIITQDVFYGLKLSDRYVNRGEPFRIPLIGVDPSGKAVNARALIRVVRYDWYTSLEKDAYGNRYRYISRKKEVVMLEQLLELAKGGSDFVYTPRESGEYEIRIGRPGSDRCVSENFYAYGWGYTTNTSFQVNTEGQVDIVADKDSYKVGDVAHLLFKAPFNGRLLITIEGDQLIEYRYVNTENKSAQLDLNIRENYLPNVYVTATVFRALDDGSIPLTVGHGFLPLLVEKPGTRLPVTLIASERSRSKTKQTITLKTTPGQNIQATLAVVDEGILALKQYQTPDPFGYFYQKKALMVEAFDVYPSLLPDLKLRRSSTGGDRDEGANMTGRVNPLSNKRVKLVALWSGVLHANAEGKASYTIDIPQFSGDLRIMACVYRDKSFGSAEAHMKIADPLVISPSVPRFLSPGDTLDMPVTLSNTTSGVTTADISLELSGPLRVIGEQKKSARIAAGSEQRVTYRLVSDPVIGEAAVTVRVNAFGESFTDKTDLTIRPVTSLLKNSGSGTITGTGTIDLENDFIPSSVKARLVISQNPVVQFSKPLSYLLGYPFGCIEQTISKAFPQIYYSDLIRDMKYGSSGGMNPAANVQEAIRKIESMQLYNGSFSYWPGGNEETWWGTNYATHFLAEARKAGYEVNPQVFQRALSYIVQKIKERKTEEHYSYIDRGGNWTERTIYCRENFYGLFLLAMYGKPDMSSMNFFKADIGKLSLDSRFMLACTYLAVGDQDAYNRLLPPAFEGERAANSFGGSYYSYIRDEAIALNVMLDTDPDNPKIPLMVRHLSKQVSTANWLNTQEAAFSFLALGKFSRRLSETKLEASLTVNGKALAAFEGKDLVLTKNITAQPVSVSVHGNGTLYYFWEVEGLSATGKVKEEDKFLQVRKSFFNRFGQPVSSGRFKQGDLVIVKISLTNLERSKVENVVVTDMLPAGFEIENPRITETAGLNWIKDQSQPDYFDVRDDRIHFFTSVDKKTLTYYYMVRAVSTGKFRMGPVSADAMYNGEYHSYYGSGTVTVE